MIEVRVSILLLFVTSVFDYYSVTAVKRIGLDTNRTFALSSLTEKLYSGRYTEGQF